MKFTQTGTFNENYLKEQVTIKPMERIQEMLLERLDYFIGFLTKEKPKLLTNYVDNLTNNFQNLIKGDITVNSPEKIEEIFTDYKNLNQYPDLNKAALNYFIHLLQLTDKSKWATDVTISTKALIQTWVFPSYYFLQTLAEAIDRNEAIKLFKRYITHFHIDHPSPNRENFVSLEKLVEKRLSGDTTASEWVIVHTLLKDGKYAFKNKNCPTCADTMVNLPDVEFKYLVVCYGDYAKFRAYYSDHLILTMEHTIIEGDPYCSRVLHDTRIDYDLRHPPKEFWDNFEPGKEEEARKYYK